MGKRNNRYSTKLVVGVTMLALMLGMSGCGNNDVGEETADSADVSMETTAEVEDVIDPSSYELQKDAVPKVNELINTYFTVMKNADEAGYMSIVSGDEMTHDKLVKKGEFIEDYLNIACYTKPGMSEGEYVAFVYYEVKFRNIDTPAPSMIRLYVCSNQDGTMYIYAGDVDAELSEYINIVSNDAELRQLENQTNQKLKADPDCEAPEADSDELVFEERNEKVITTTALRVRSTPTTDTDDNILGKVEAGEELKRIGYNDSWSKIIYNGKEAYVSSEYVITK